MNCNNAPRVTSVKEAYDVFKDIAEETQEVLSAAFLNSAHGVLGRMEIFRGTITHITASPREILRAALLKNATKILIAHNHPSQDPLPSAEDQRFTKQLERAACLVGIPLLDHLIICQRNVFYSFAASKQLGRFLDQGARWRDYR